MRYAVFGVPKGQSEIIMLKGGLATDRQAFDHLQRLTRFGGVTGAYIVGVEHEEAHTGGRKVEEVAHVQSSK